MKKQEVLTDIGIFLLIEVESDSFNFTVDKLTEKSNIKVINYKRPYKDRSLGYGFNLKEYNTKLKDVVMKGDTISDELWETLTKEVKWKCEKNETVIVELA